MTRGRVCTPLVLLTLSGCLPPPPQVHDPNATNEEPAGALRELPLPGRKPISIKVAPDDLRFVDVLIEGEPRNDPTQACQYWKQAVVRFEEAERPAVLRMALDAQAAWCGSRDSSAGTPRGLDAGLPVVEHEFPVVRPPPDSGAIVRAAPAQADGGAERTKPLPPSQQDGHWHIIEGRRAERAGDLDLALTELAAAHRMLGTPSLLKDLAALHAKKGDAARASAMLGRYTNARAVAVGARMVMPRIGYLHPEARVYSQLAPGVGGEMFHFHRSESDEEWIKVLVVAEASERFGIIWQDYARWEHGDSRSATDSVFDAISHWVEKGDVVAPSQLKRAHDKWLRAFRKERAAAEEKTDPELAILRREALRRKAGVPSLLAKCKQLNKQLEQKMRSRAVAARVDDAHQAVYNKLTELVELMTKAKMSNDSIDTLKGDIRGACF